MKEAYDKEGKDGKLVQVSADTPTDNKGGVRYLLTPERKTVELNKALAFEKAKPERDKRKKDDALIAAYTSAWPMHKQLEALQDKLNGDSTKLDKMNADFTAIRNEA